jgi:nucleoside-diphosphate-sugar epimerase
MKLAIFGATGTAGSELLTQALAAGHEVRALVRTPTKLPPQPAGSTVVQGDVRDLAAVSQTVLGCEAVLSALGATDKRDADVRRAGTANIVAAMREQRARRLVVLGGFHIPFEGDPDNLGRKLIVPILGLTKYLVEDTVGMGALIHSCELDWTLVRIPRIARSPAPGRPEIDTLRLGPWSKVSRATIASFMLECAADGTYLHRAPMICDRKA